jgi:hypothetical protein
MKPPMYIGLRTNLYGPAATNLRECECSTGSDQGDAQGARPVGQRDAKSDVVAVVQVYSDPAPQKNESGAKDCGAKRDEQRFHGSAFLKVSSYFIYLLLSLMLGFL